MDRKIIGIDSLPVFKDRYKVTKENLSICLNNMNIKDREENVWIQRVQDVIQRLDRDIKATEAMIKELKFNRKPIAEKESWLATFHIDRKVAVEFMANVKQWIQDPLDVVFEKGTIVYDRRSKQLSYHGTEDYTPRISGGCLIQIENMTAVDDPSGHVLLKERATDIASLSPQRILPVSKKPSAGLLSRLAGFVYRSQAQTSASGILFKLPFEEIEMIEGGVQLSAQGHLYRSDIVKYPMNDTIALTLHAIKSNDINLFNTLRGKVRTWNFQDARGVSLLHYAAAALNPLFLQEVICHKPDLNIRDSQGYTAMHYAARSGHVEGLKLLAQTNRGLLDAVSIHGETPLYQAVDHGQIACVRLLIEQGANTTITPTHGRNVLSCALSHGSEDIALALLRTKSIDLHASSIGSEAMRLSIEKKMEGVLKELCIQSVDINRADHEGVRPVHLVVMHDWLMGLKILVGCPHFKPNVTEWSSGKTALDLADPVHQEAMIALLKQKTIEYGQIINPPLSARSNASSCVIA